MEKDDDLLIHKCDDCGSLITLYVNRRGDTRMADMDDVMLPEPPDSVVGVFVLVVLKFSMETGIR